MNRMASAVTGFFLLLAAVPLTFSCMMALDDEMIMDDAGRVTLAVRGYVYLGTDAPPVSGTLVTVSVYDRADKDFSSPLAVVRDMVSESGYYDLRVSFAAYGDIMIRVYAADPADSSSSGEVTGVFSWGSSHYDSELGAYCINMPPVYME